MKHSKSITIVIAFLLSQQLLYSDISVDSSGLNQGVNETIDKAEDLLEKEREEAERLAEVNRIYENSITPIATSNDATESESNVNENSDLNKESSTPKEGVKEIYVGTTTSLGKQYVIKCYNGNSYNSIHLRNNGFWYSGISNMGDNYKDLSINDVALKKCH